LDWIPVLRGDAEGENGKSKPELVKIRAALSNFDSAEKLRE
jgi:hypothetical protein